MSLSDFPIGAVYATADFKAAREFYEGKLGMTPDSVDEETQMVGYKAGDGTGFNVYLSPDHAGKNTATAAGWAVDDVEKVVDELTENGVTFEQYGEDDGPGSTDEKGIIRFEGGAVAFFRDPDGNTHSINQA